MPSSYSEAKKFYMQEESHNWGRFDKEEEAKKYFANYLDFIEKHIPISGKLLEIGCSPGWSCYLLAQKGFKVTGVDLTVEAFLHNLREKQNNIDFIAGDATNLNGILDETYDVVASYQMIEHVDKPEKALNEMIRVVKPEGYIVIGAPNLLSPIHSVKTIFSILPKELSFKHWWINNPALPRKPFGNTIPEACFIALHNIYRIAKKLFLPGYSFDFRTPDFTPPAHGDADSVYLVNIIDLERFFKKNNFKIIANTGGNAPWLGFLSGGTWMIAQKKNL